MYGPLSDQFLPALRTSVAIFSTASHRDPFTGDVTKVPISDGDVTYTSDPNSLIRATLNLTCPAMQDLFDAFAAPGGEITVTQTLRYINQKTETIPLGVFVVDSDQIGYKPDDTFSLTCRDRGVIVQRNRFANGHRSSVPTNQTSFEIQRLVEGAFGSGYNPFRGWAQLDRSATAIVGSRLWDDGDREKAILAMTQDNALQVYFDRTGQAVQRPLPVLTSSSPSVWTVNEAAEGVMIGADRSRDRTVVYNAVEATTNIQGLILPVQVAMNTDPADPLSVHGPLGYVPLYLSGAYITSAQALAAAKATLAKALGTAQQITLEAASNPALDADDVVLAVLPHLDFDGDPVTELHIAETVTVPLLPTGTQTITTRSTRPADALAGGT